MLLRFPDCAAAIGLAWLICGARICQAQAGHSASVAVGDDPTGAPTYVGTSNPPPGAGINLVGSSPGYLNAITGAVGISGFVPDSTNGELPVGPFPPGKIELFAIAITTSDTAGPPHSLSSMNDQALPDIVSDLNAGVVGGPAVVNVYAYGSTPPQFSDALATLSAGESANGGRPFDILVTGTPLLPSLEGPPWWVLGLSNEVGNLDGITSLSVTDIGATAFPEPGAFIVCVVAIGAMMLTRRRERVM